MKINNNNYYLKLNYISYPVIPTNSGLNGNDPVNDKEIEAELYLNQNNLQAALRLYEENLYTIQNNNNSYYVSTEDNYYRLAHAHNNLGKVYYLMRNYTNSLQNYKISLQYYLKLKEIKSSKKTNFTEYSKDNMELARCYRHLGVVQRDMGNTNDAISSLFKARKIMEEIKNREPSTKVILEEMAIVLFDLALALHNQSGESYSEEAENCLRESADLFSRAGISSSDQRVRNVQNAIQVFNA